MRIEKIISLVLAAERLKRCAHDVWGAQAPGPAFQDPDDPPAATAVASRFGVCDLALSRVGKAFVQQTVSTPFRRIVIVGQLGEGALKRCSRCARRSASDATICNGCGDWFFGNYMPALFLIALLIPVLVFTVAVSRQPGFMAHPKRVALALLGLGPSEDAISAAMVAAATRSGIVTRQRDLFAFDVNEAAWKAMPDAARDQLKAAFVQRVYGSDPRSDEVVKVYAGSSRRVVTSIKRAKSG